MIPWLADPNLDDRILQGLSLLNPEADLVRLRDIELSEADDDAVLAHAASSGRVAVTHDVNTMVGVACRKSGRQSQCPA